MKKTWKSTIKTCFPRLFVAQTGRNPNFWTNKQILFPRWAAPLVAWIGGPHHWLQVFGCHLTDVAMSRAADWFLEKGGGPILVARKTNQIIWVNCNILLTLKSSIIERMIPLYIHHDCSEVTTWGHYNLSRISQNSVVKYWEIHAGIPVQNADQLMWKQHEESHLNGKWLQISRNLSGTISFNINPLVFFLSHGRSPVVTRWVYLY